MNPVEVHQGNSPVVLGFPHTGTWLPEDIFAQLNNTGKTLADTDWHVHTLYDGLLPNATTVRATFHRYVIDANRAPDNESLYPGQNTTDLVSVTDFDGKPVWHQEPTPGDIAERLTTYHQAYHQALKTELDRVKAQHGFVVLYDCHSIRSDVPFLFDGKLPDFNIGTAEGTTCAPAIQQAVETTCAKAEGYTSVCNGRFKGGWTTRHYGNPSRGYHAIQMELAQSTYLESETLPFAYSASKAAKLRVHLREILISIAALKTPHPKGA